MIPSKQKQGRTGGKCCSNPTLRGSSSWTGCLPDTDGIELCRKIRNEGVTRPYVYVILLTGKDGRKNMLTAMQAGVDDYLVKPFDASELKARVLVGKRILDLQQELISAREAMRHAATHDSLTGLMNRGQVMDILNRELARSTAG